MAIWLAENAGNLLVAGILALAVGMIVRKLIKDKKRGRSSCGCSCSGCGMSGSCHKKNTK